MKKALLAGMGLVLLVSSAALAKPKEDRKGFEKKHPRRTEVLKRDDRQKARIDKAEDSGKLTKGQAAADMKAERKIRRQEERDAAKNGGHITKAEQKQLNREETRENRRIKRQEARDAAKGAGSAGGAAGGNTGGAPAAAPAATPAQ